MAVTWNHEAEAKTLTINSLSHGDALIVVNDIEFREAFHLMEAIDKLVIQAAERERERISRIISDLNKSLGARQ